MPGLKTGIILTTSPNTTIHKQLPINPLLLLRLSRLHLFHLPEILLIGLSLMFTRLSIIMVTILMTVGLSILVLIIITTLLITILVVLLIIILVDVFYLLECHIA